MHLVACPRPQEPLEVAPRSALLADPTEKECWDGFWAADRYIVRCTKSGGAIEWFTLADDVASGAEGTRTTRLRAAVALEARVLPFRARGPRARTATGRVTVLVAKSPEGRRMLVGTTHRGSRSGGRRSAE